MIKLNQKGFTGFEVVLIVIALVAIGAAGYFAYEARQDKTVLVAAPKKTEKTIQAQPQPVSSKPETTSVYNIKDLGVEFALPSSISDLSYKVVNLGGEQAVSSVTFSTKRLEAAGCSLDSAPLGHLTYTEGKGGILVASARGSNLYYIEPKGSCSADPSLRNWQKLKEALKTTVSDYKGG